VKVISPTAEGNMGKLKVEMVYSNLEENFCLNICVLLRCESIVATPDPSYKTKPMFAKGQAKGKLGGVC
jgi:hypothetical protein